MARMRVKYVGGIDTWNEYLTKDKIYLIREDYGEFVALKVDDGTVKLVPIEVFENADLESELLFNNALIHVMKGLLLLFVAFFLVLSIWDAYYLVFAAICGIFVVMLTPFKKYEKR